MPIVEQLQQEQLDELGVKDIALGAAMTAASIFGGANAQSKIPTDKPSVTVSSTRTGTQVDGINGSFTSQFRFPKAFLKDLNTGKIQNLGFEGNEALSKINASGITITQMEEWNKFVEWMKSKGLSGSKQMDHILFSEDALKQYKTENPTFWIKDSNDIKKVQGCIKAYRVYTIGIWKLGVDNAIKKGYQPVAIEFGSKEMDHNNPEDVKRVDSNYMIWAK